MNDISDAVDLLATAREALTDEILPLLPKERRYVGLMINNVIGIATRELQSGATATADEAERIAQLLQGQPNAANGPIEGREADLEGLRRTLCSAIRSGRFDAGNARDALAAHLARTTRDWVAISNPKALRSA